MIVQLQNKRFIYYFIILLLFFSCKQQESKEISSKSSRPRVVVSAMVDKSTATIGDQIIFTISVNHLPGIETEIGSVNNIPDLPIIDMGSDNPRNEEGRIESIKWYKLKADRIGSFIIPPVIVKYKAKEGDKSSQEEKEVSTPKIFVEVKSVLNEGETANDIKDLKPLAEFRRDWKWIIIAIAGIILIVIIIYILYRRSQANKKKIVISTPALPPHEIALRELRKLKEKGLVEMGNFKPYYFELSEIFRRYLARRYEFPAEDWTTEEIMNYLKNYKKCEHDVLDEVLSFLTNTDRVKFAKRIPNSSESEGEFNKSLIIIEKTKLMVSEVKFPI